MRTNITIIRHADAQHGKANPNWEPNAVTVFAGRGRQAEIVRMVPIICDGTSYTGWDERGRYITVRNVRGHR